MQKKKMPPVGVTAVVNDCCRLRATFVDSVRRRRLPPQPPPSPTMPPHVLKLDLHLPSAAPHVRSKPYMGFWLVGLLSAPHVFVLTPIVLSITKMSLTQIEFLIGGVTSCTPRICAYTHTPLNYQNALNPS